MLYLITGRRELGKTTLAQWIARRASRQRVIFDPRQTVPVTERGVRVTELDELRPWIESMHDTDPRTEVDLLVTPYGDVRAMFAGMCDALRDWIREDDAAGRRRRLAGIIDEARLVPAIDRVPSFDFLLRCTPRSTMHILLTCHRPTDVPVSVRAIMDYWLMFHTTQRHDLDAIAERAGDDVADDVAELGPYEFIEWDDSRFIARAHLDSRRWSPLVRDVERGDAYVWSSATIENVLNKPRLF